MQGGHYNREKKSRIFPKNSSESNDMLYKTEILQFIRFVVMSFAHLRLYGTYIPNQKFTIRISILRDTTKIFERPSILKTTRTLILHDINFE